MTDARAVDSDPRLGMIEQDPRPVVALPRSTMSGGLITVIVGLLAIVLFVILNGQRRHATGTQADRRQATLIASPPPLVVPPEPRPIPVVPLGFRPPQPVPLIRLPRPAFVPPQTVIVPVAPVLLTKQAETEPSRQSQPRLTEPALVFDGGTPVAGASAAPPGGAGQNVGQGRLATAGAAGDDMPARATLIRSRTDVMPIGTLIPAVLETPIDTARPGLVRALVSRASSGFDGRRVLVPRGSRLIGEYQADVRGGQNRVLVTWTRLIRPDGVSIRLGSPAADALGGAGIPGQVHSFFLQRFAGAVLQSALQVGVNIASRPRNGSVIVGIPSAPVNAVGQQVQAVSDYRPKITVKQGAALNIFVARDLDFSGVGAPR